MDLKKGEETVRRATEDAQRMARKGLRAVIDDLRARGHDVIGCGIVLASGRPATTLAATLASHALIHTAEGDRKSTRLNSSHVRISYAVFCLKKKRKTTHHKVV